MMFNNKKQGGMKMDLNHILETRRSVRQFSGDDVPKPLIDRLLAKCARASTTGNMQLYSAVVTRDAAMKEKLAPAHFRQPAFVNAPVSITFCADFHRFNRWCEVSRASAGFDNGLSFLTAMTDAVIVAQTFALLAEQEGLGICFLGTAMYNARLISEVLSLPKGVVPVTTIAVGFPSGDSAKSDRIDPSAWVFDEKYEDYSEKRIRDIFDYKEDLPENRRFIEENGKETLAQVFTDVRYTKEANEHFTREYFQLLKENGFLE